MSQQNANAVNITGGTIAGIAPLAVAYGGTSGSTQASARAGLGLGSISTQNANAVNISGGSIYNIADLAVVDGGTGASNATDARLNLGLGSISTQAASAVAITGGTIAGITPLAVADGGTGGATASQARVNLGLGTIATQNASGVAITGGSITGITPLPLTSGGTGSNTAGQARLNLGLGSISTQDASAVSIGGGSMTNMNITNSAIDAYYLATDNARITGGSISGITPLPVASGGTSANNSIDALKNLGAVWEYRSILAGAGLAGGGYLNYDVTLSIATNSNGYGVRTVSSARPSGGNNGDIWYQI